MEHTVSATRLPRGSKKNKTLRQRVGSGLLTALSVVFVLSPVVTIGVWASQFFDDPRGNVTLNSIAVATQHEPKLFEEPIITIAFDDGWYSIYQNAQLLEKHSIRTTQYILPGNFNDPQYMSKDHVYQMVKAGHDIQSHTMSHPHLPVTTLPDVEKELRESKAILGNVTGREVTDFASPYGKMSPSVLEHVKKVYRSHRNTNGDLTNLDSGDINIKDKFDIFNINSYTVKNTDTAEDLQKLIEYTKQQKGWLVLTYHQVDNSGALFSVTPAALDAQLAQIKKSGIRTATMSETINAYEKARR